MRAVMPVPLRLQVRDFPIALLLAFALLARMVVPTGWMPVFDGSELRLEMCGGSAPPPEAMQAMHAMQGGKHGDPSRHGARHEPPCPYAALSFAATTSEALFIAAAPPIHTEPGAFPEAQAAVGRGLAAPPPPATGPPFLA
jgi:hypothetical protein